MLNLPFISLVHNHRSACATSLRVIFTIFASTEGGEKLLIFSMFQFLCLLASMIRELTHCSLSPSLGCLIGVTIPNIHRSFQMSTNIQSPIIHLHHLKRITFASQIPLQAKEGLGPSLASKNSILGKYLTLYNLCSRDLAF